MKLPRAEQSSAFARPPGHREGRSQLPRAEPRGRLALEHVSVIDATGAPARADRMVVIEDGRIRSIGKNRKVPGATVIDASGKFLIPGLWDMHVHGAGRADYLDLFVANGVTGIRDMFDSLSEINKRRAEIRDGSRRGPRIVAAGRVLDGPTPILPGATAINNAREAEAAVDAAAAEGCDFVKLYSLLPRDAYFAAAARAKERGLPFVGHVPESISVAEASDAGQRSVEHLTGVLMACSSRENELRSQLAADIRGGSALSVGYRTFLYCSAEALESFSRDKADALFGRFTRNATWHCPTLTVLRGFAYLDTEEFTSDPRVIFLPAWLRLIWNPKGGFVTQYLTHEDFANLKQGLRKDLELVGMMRRAGVNLLAGTDTSGPYCFPGFSLHDELELLVRGGLTPMEALQAATLNPARFLGQSDRLGTVEAGKIADLVLLEANPLEDIRNTRKIAGVVLGGGFIARAELQATIARIEAAARK